MLRITAVITATLVTLTACDGSTTSAPNDTPTTGPAFTMSSGAANVLLGRANLGDFHVQTNSNHFNVELKSHDNADIELTNGTYQAGGHSGWHSHPGPVFVIVKSGALTVYDAGKECRGTIYPAGTGFIDATEPHIIRNEGAVVAEIYALFFLPGGSLRRIDENAPGNCPF